MKQLPILQSGDTVEIIAPASRCSNQRLADLKELLTSWQLNCLVAADIFGEDLLCANTDAKRFQFLKNALQNPQTKAVICARGGYGSTRLIPELNKIVPPASAKWFVGMSDITALNLFLEQRWQWPTVHGALTRGRFSPASIDQLKAILFAEVEQFELTGLPLNSPAEKNQTLDATLTGGNLCLVQTGIGTLWQIDGKNKIIFLEEVRERGYRIDRMLEHLKQANVFNNAAAILFGDFIEGKEPNGTSLVQPVLERFAQQTEIPVMQVADVGHGYNNFPMLLGKNVKLQLGKQIKLTYQVNANKP